MLGSRERVDGVHPARGPGEPERTIGRGETEDAQVVWIGNGGSIARWV